MSPPTRTLKGSFLDELEKIAVSRHRMTVAQSRKGRRPMRVDTLLRKEKEGTLYKNASRLREAFQVVRNMDAPEHLRHFGLHLDGKQVGSLQAEMPWGAALKGGLPGGGPKVPTVINSFIDPKYRGLGLGKKLYGEALRQMPEHTLASDHNLSHASAGIWEGMAKRRGYAVKKIKETQPTEFSIPGKGQTSYHGITSGSSAPIYEATLNMKKKMGASRNAPSDTPFGSYPKRSSGTRPRKKGDVPTYQDGGLTGGELESFGTTTVPGVVSQHRRARFGTSLVQGMGNELQKISGLLGALTAEQIEFLKQAGIIGNARGALGRGVANVAGAVERKGMQGAATALRAGNAPIGQAVGDARGAINKRVSNWADSAERKGWQGGATTLRASNAPIETGAMGHVVQDAGQRLQTPNRNNFTQGVGRALQHEGHTLSRGGAGAVMRTVGKVLNPVGALGEVGAAGAGNVAAKAMKFAPGSRGDRVLTHHIPKAFEYAVPAAVGMAIHAPVGAAGLIGGKAMAAMGGVESLAAAGHAVHGGVFNALGQGAAEFAHHGAADIAGTHAPGLALGTARRGARMIPGRLAPNGAMA